MYSKETRNEIIRVLANTAINDKRIKCKNKKVLEKASDAYLGFGKNDSRAFHKFINDFAMEEDKK